MSRELLTISHLAVAASAKPCFSGRIAPIKSTDGRPYWDYPKPTHFSERSPAPELACCARRSRRQRPCRRGFLAARGVIQRRMSLEARHSCGCFPSALRNQCSTAFSLQNPSGTARFNPISSFSADFELCAEIEYALAAGRRVSEPSRPNKTGAATPVNFSVNWTLKDKRKWLTHLGVQGAML